MEARNKAFSKKKVVAVRPEVVSLNAVTGYEDWDVDYSVCTM